MPNTLLEIVAHKEQEIAGRPNIQNQFYPAAPRKNFLQALQQPGVNLIAEIKPRSPSAGVLCPQIILEEIVPIYNRHATAISVLTDKKYFAGSLENLSRVKQLSEHPVLCKDFIISPRQIHDAYRAAADAVLLIVKILSLQKLQHLYELIGGLNMTPVMEIQNETELQTALMLRPQLLLINNRNLETLEIDLKTTAALAPLIPRDITVISASGISTRNDIEFLLPYAHNFLVGSSLMTAGNLESKLRELCRR